MQVRLLIHLEKVPDGDPAFVWWAESPDLPGFSAAADHLPELLARAHAAIPEVLREEGRAADDVAVVPVLAGSTETAGNAAEPKAERGVPLPPSTRHVAVVAT